MSGQHKAGEENRKNGVPIVELDYMGKEWGRKGNKDE